MLLFELRMNDRPTVGYQYMVYAIPVASEYVDGGDARAVSCTQTYASSVVDQPSDDTNTVAYSYTGLSDPQILVNSSDPPSTILASDRIPDD